MTDFTKHSGQPGDADPYRYGPPPAPVPASQPSPTGKQILTATWGLLKQDRELIALPVVGSLFALVAFVVFFVPSLFIGGGDVGSGHQRFAVYVGVVLGGFLASIVSIFFQAALVIGAYQRADGYDPTFGGTLAAAWKMRRQIFGWAVFTTIVGTAIRLVEQRLGIFGRILGFLGGIAWAIATFFVVPVIVAEGLGPIEALKHSANTIKQVWGTSVRTTLRFGVIQFVLTIVPAIVFAAGVVLVSSGNAAGGVPVAAVGLIALFLLGAIFSAITTYARGLIYRWSTGRPVPGIDPALFAGAFRPRGRNRSRY
jgi:hypothetical protein